MASSVRALPALCGIEEGEGEKDYPRRNGRDFWINFCPSNRSRFWIVASQNRYLERVRAQGLPRFAYRPLRSTRSGSASATDNCVIFSGLDEAGFLPSPKRVAFSRQFRADSSL